MCGRYVPIGNMITPLTLRRIPHILKEAVIIRDVMALIDILLNGSMEFKMGGDLDSDGKVTISDLTTLIDLLLSSAKE